MSAVSVFSSGSTALISGGASGIGLALAKLCKSKGMSVALVDRNASALEQAKQEVSGIGSSEAKVESYELDVSKLDQWEKLKGEVTAAFGSVEFLAMNAGMGMKGGWGDSDYFRTTLETNLFGVLNGVNVFLPLVKEAAQSKQTAVVFTGSKQGITNPPGNPAYNASKAAVKALAEQLCWELRGTKTSVHLLVPGWTYTGLTGATPEKQKPAGAWTPEQVAEFLEKKMGENQFYVICPDNEVTEETDKKRMLWAVGDVVYGRPPLSRWSDDWKEKAADGVANMKL